MADGPISGDASLAAGSIAGGDLVPVVDISEPADADKNKNISFTILETYLNSNLNFNNYSHPNHSGHVSSSGDGATTLLVAAITGQTELASGLVGTDELLVSDGGVIKRMDVSVMNAYFNANLNFNNYVHPSYTARTESGDTGPLTGATVISDLDFNFSSDTQGHVTAMDITTLATRELTPGDIGAATSGHNHSGVYEPVDATILRQADVDDIPVNGVTQYPISSNWAFDHQGGNEHIDWTAATQNLDTSGSIEGATLALSTAYNGVTKTTNNDALYISGSNTVIEGANAFFCGESHPTSPYDIVFRSASVYELQFDYSANTWDFNANDLLIDEIRIAYATKGIHLTVNDDVFRISGGDLVTNGANLRLYGQSHSTKAYDIDLYAGPSSSVLSLDYSALTWTVGNSINFVTAASIAARAGLRLPHGTAPTSPVNGDVWTTTSSIFARINGATVDLGGGGGEALWQEQNTSITGTKGSRYVKASGASHTITLPTTPKVTDDPNFVAVWNNDTDTSTVTVDPNGTNSLYLRGENLGAGVAVVLQPGEAVLCVGRQTSGTAWDVMYIHGVIGITDNSTVSNMTINDGNVTFEDEIIIDNVGLTTDNTFKIGARTSSIPYIQFDTLDYLEYSRSNNYYQFVMNGGVKLDIDYYHVRIPNPLFIIEQSADNADQPGYGQFWVENLVPNEPRFTGDTGVIHPLGRRLNPAPASDHQASGTIASMELGATVVFGDLLHMDTDGQLILADADAIATMPVFGVALAGGSATQFIDVLLSGFIRDDSWAWTPIGAPVYASTTAGDFTTTAPTGALDVVQVLGIVTHADRIYFNPSSDWIEL